MSQRNEKTVEEIYQKKTQLEHILLRPDTYIGSVEMTTCQLWVLAENEEKFEYKQIEYVPGFYKIFDEILVNAADNYQRDTSMNMIKVVIDPVKNFISVWNNGKGIPCQMHNEYKVYVPELIFGQLLSGSNYDDTQKKVVGGRNGYGAKLTNIFSKMFSVECADSKNQKLFQKTWRHNMSTSSLPEISQYKSGSDYTCVSWESDLKLFGMTELTPDTVALLKKRVYDLAGIYNSKIKVFLNGKHLKLQNFSKYVDFYLTNPEETPKIYDTSTENDRWEVLVSLSDGQFQQVSFVNSICTTRGGTHVDFVTNQIVDRLSEAIAKKNKNKLQIKSHQIKSNLWIFVNCLIENPTFDSQTKETLTLKSSLFGSKWNLTEKYITQLLKTDIVQQIISQAEARQNAKLAKTLNGSKKSRLLGIPKLDDANDAGTRNAESCTLILTEGDSAKSLAMAGIEVVGRDKYGVFPLRGKLLNVREANGKQIGENQEIQNLIKIIGLQLTRKYEDVKSLRYGSIMIMADQDYDGSHIKGLIINFIHHFWPELVRMNGFIKEFATPIMKVTKGEQVFSFFTISDFKQWSQNQNLKTWKIKYYKGLGTSTDKEAQEYFHNLNKHKIDFKWEDNADDDSIDLMFNKKRADDRKRWLQTYDPESYLDHNIKVVRYLDFTNKEMIQFSMADNLRSIPSICDGLKPGQRKILFSCFKRNLKGEIKVAQLSGYVAEHSAYHHGEISLAQTIIGMSQNFVGSNNINLLMPIGQFGTRNQGGKDHASARYIFTSLNKITRFLFPEADDHLYKYLEDDGQIVEPEWYLPIIPLVLVNGSDGIGTGWSTNTPCFNPREIVESIKKKLNGQDFEELHPWYKGFSGEIEMAAKGYTVTGRYEVNEEGQIEILELPIKRWTKEYKAFLEEEFVMNSKNPNPEIEDIKEYHTNNRVHFILQPKEGYLNNLLREGIEKKFKLQSTLQITNMVLFNNQGKLQRYNNVKEILQEFYDLRLTFYDNRKKYLVSKLRRDLEILSNKARFILAVINEEVHLRNRKKKDVCEQLVKLGFVQMKNMPKILSTKLINEQQKEENIEGEDENDDSEIGNISKEYNYLLSLPLWSLTFEKVENFKKEVKCKEEELNIIIKTSLENMWINDLDQFLLVLDEVEMQEEKDRISRPQIKGGAIGKKPRKPRKKKGVEEDEEEEKEKDEKTKKNVKKDNKKIEKVEKNDKADKIEKNEKPAKKKAVTKIVDSDSKKEWNLKIDKDKNPSVSQTQLTQPSQSMGLAERLQAKEKEGKLPDSYYEGYKNFMETSQKIQEEQELGNKRKPIQNIEKNKIKKKNKIDDEDDEDIYNILVNKGKNKENSNMESNSNPSTTFNRPARQGVKKNKIIFSDSEEEKSSDEEFVAE